MHPRHTVKRDELEVSSARLLATQRDELERKLAGRHLAGDGSHFGEPKPAASSLLELSSALPRFAFHGLRYMTVTSAHEFHTCGVSSQSQRHESTYLPSGRCAGTRSWSTSM